MFLHLLNYGHVSWVRFVSIPESLSKLFVRECMAHKRKHFSDLALEGSCFQLITNLV